MCVCALLADITLNMINKWTLTAGGTQPHTRSAQAELADKTCADHGLYCGKLNSVAFIAACALEQQLAFVFLYVCVCVYAQGSSFP